MIVVGGTSTARLSAIGGDRATRIGAGVVLAEADAEFLGESGGTGGGGKVVDDFSGLFPSPDYGQDWHRLSSDERCGRFVTK
ncbi:hypothetical protein [Cryobacterium arcticum]|uniref:hypothetical protein n=1 Tax=Cryobacterium arcticum TaxID=670052 RepID=UPI0011B84644|nr:hypothetical protein [Cryobacterium arcticum]